MCENGHAAHHGYTPEKESYLRRLRLIEGQARGVARMVESDEYCIDVLTQISAVQAALKAVSLGLLDDHLRHCVAHATAVGGEEAEQKLDEAMTAIRRMAK